MDNLKASTNAELIAELISRDSFTGIVIYYGGDVTINREQNVIVEMSNRLHFLAGIESLLETTKGLVHVMFGEK